MKIQAKVNSLDAWACIYALIVLIISIFTSSFSLLLFGLYFILALPFVRSVEHYIVICLLFSTISYYFTGAYEEIYSMYTILVVLIVLKTFIIDGGFLQFSKKNILSIIALIVLSLISYKLSKFNYSNGLYRLGYLLIVSIFVGNFVRCRLKTICEILPKIAATMVLGYLFTIAISGIYIDGRLTIANDINTNTFGMSCAQLGCILLMTAFFNKEHRMRNIVLCTIILILALLSGSRGAILAFILSCLIVVIVYSKRAGTLSGSLFKLSIAGIVLLCLVYFLVIFTGLDTSRFKISDIIASGGSRRTLIYSSLIPYIFENGFWKFGYGPGHECSRQIILSLIGWDYSHSHNLFLESFGELGIGGLIFTCICLFRSLIDIDKISKKYENSYVLVAMLICLVINGMAESYFIDAVFWILIAVCRNNFIDIENIDSETSDFLISNEVI